jgi:hypothetical protein
MINDAHAILYSADAEGGRRAKCWEPDRWTRRRLVHLHPPAPGRVKLGHSICTSVSIQRQCKLA